MRPVDGALAILVVLTAWPAARAAPGEHIRFYPSNAVPDAASLQAILSDPASPVRTVVVGRDAPPLAEPLLVERDDFVLCGEGGNPSRSVLESSASEAVVLRGTRRVTLRGLIIRTMNPAGIALSLSAVPSPVVRSFVEDTTIRDCILEGATCLAATVGVNGVTVDRTAIRVTRPGGRGVLWQDGTGLFVARCRFESARGVAAAAALEVRGAQDPEAEGGRAERIVLSRNRVSGDFETGFELGDVADVRVYRNRIRFSQPLRGDGGGRVGIALRRRAASSPPEDFEIFLNSFRGIHTGLWLVEPGDDAWVQYNDFRGCASPVPDTLFGDEGGAVRVELGTPRCPRLRIRFNDFRGLRSARDVPAALVLPVGSEGACFTSGVDANRKDRNRELYEGEGPP